MEKVIAAKKKQVNTILELLKDGNMSSEGFKSSDQPWFMSEEKLDKIVLNNNFTPEVPDNLNLHIKILYNMIDPDREIYLGEWTIMSLNQVLKIYKDYCSEGQKNVFDIAYRYMGMGHIEVLSCNLYNHLLFYHPDGGSNGYDRMDNHKKIIKFNYKDYEYMVFTNWAKKVKDDIKDKETNEDNNLE